MVYIGERDRQNRIERAAIEAERLKAEGKSREEAVRIGAEIHKVDEGNVSERLASSTRYEKKPEHYVSSKYTKYNELKKLAQMQTKNIDDTKLAEVVISQPSTKKLQETYKNNPRAIARAHARIEGYSGRFKDEHLKRKAERLRNIVKSNEKVISDMKSDYNKRISDTITKQMNLDYNKRIIDTLNKQEKSRLDEYHKITDKKNQKLLNPQLQLREYKTPKSYNPETVQPVDVGKLKSHQYSSGYIEDPVKGRGYFSFYNLNKQKKKIDKWVKVYKKVNFRSNPESLLQVTASLADFAKKKIDLITKYEKWKHPEDKDRDKRYKKFENINKKYEDEIDSLVKQNTEYSIDKANDKVQEMKGNAIDFYRNEHKYTNSPHEWNELDNIIRSINDLPPTPYGSEEQVKRNIKHLGEYKSQRKEYLKEMGSAPLVGYWLARRGRNLYNVFSNPMFWHPASGAAYFGQDILKTKGKTLSDIGRTFYHEPIGTSADFWAIKKTYDLPKKLYVNPMNIPEFKDIYNKLPEKMKPEFEANVRAWSKIRSLSKSELRSELSEFTHKDLEQFSKQEAKWADKELWTQKEIDYYKGSSAIWRWLDDKVKKDLVKKGMNPKDADIVVKKGLLPKLSERILNLDTRSLKHLQKQVAKHNINDFIVDAKVIDDYNPSNKVQKNAVEVAKTDGSMLTGQHALNRYLKQKQHSFDNDYKSPQPKEFIQKVFDKSEHHKTKKILTKKHLIDSISYKNAGLPLWIMNRLTKKKILGEYNPITEQITIDKGLIKKVKEPKTNVLLHEYGHKIDPYIQGIEKLNMKQVHKDFKKLSPEAYDFHKTHHLSKYFKEDHPFETVADFVKYNPNELIKPTTLTGRNLKWVSDVQIKNNLDISFKEGKTYRINQISGKHKTLGKEGQPFELHQIIDKKTGKPLVESTNLEWNTPYKETPSGLRIQTVKDAYLDKIEAISNKYKKARWTKDFNKLKLMQDNGLIQPKSVKTLGFVKNKKDLGNFIIKELRELTKQKYYLSGARNVNIGKSKQIGHFIQLLENDKLSFDRGRIKTLKGVPIDEPVTATGRQIKARWERGLGWKDYLNKDLQRLNAEMETLRDIYSKKYKNKVLFPKIFERNLQVIDYGREYIKTHTKPKWEIMSMKEALKKPISLENLNKKLNMKIAKAIIDKKGNTFIVNPDYKRSGYLYDKRTSKTKPYLYYIGHVNNYPYINNIKPYKHYSKPANYNIPYKYPKNLDYKYTYKPRYPTPYELPYKPPYSPPYKPPYSPPYKPPYSPPYKPPYTPPKVPPAKKSKPSKKFPSIHKDEKISDKKTFAVNVRGYDRKGGVPKDRTIAVGITLKDALSAGETYVDRNPETSFTVAKTNKKGNKYVPSAVRFKFYRRGNRWYEKNKYRTDSLVESQAFKSMKNPFTRRNN